MVADRETALTDVKLTIVDREGQTRDVVAANGAVLMQVLRDNVDLTLGTCGGALSCGTCLVHLCPQWLAAVPAPSEFEAEMLEALEAAADCRLSCQIALDSAANNMKATIAPAR